MENKSTKIEGHSFISKEQISELHEIKDMCFLSSVKERKAFLTEVAQSVGANSVNEITVDNFGSAWLTAKAILHSIGENVFKKQKCTYAGDLYE